MYHVLLTLAALAVVAFAADTAMAGNRYRSSSRGYVEYHGYHEYSSNLGGYYDNRYRGDYRPYTSRYSRSYRPGRYSAGHGLGMTHDEAVRRIMAKHSRSRYHTHPRSMYNGPPSYR